MVGLRIVRSGMDWGFGLLSGWTDSRCGVSVGPVIVLPGTQYILLYSGNPFCLGIGFNGLAVLLNPILGVHPYQSPFMS